MTALKMDWATPAKKQFDELHQRATATSKLDEFLSAHKELMKILADFEQAIAKSDPLYNTKKPGGVVRHILHRFLSVTFYLFPEKRIGWITKYQAVPTTWPF
ncbi:MAG: hypothetical protein HY289_11930 [Planctomycetes bacterium]|nr:hypothetical protein [Planctomycetota bacterium]